MYRVVLTVVVYWTQLQEYHCEPIPEDGEDTSSTDFNLGDDVIRYEVTEDGIATRAYFTAQQWPNNTEGLVIVPYKNKGLDSSTFSDFQKIVQEFNQKSCIRWVPYDGDDPSMPNYYVNLHGSNPSYLPARSSDDECYASHGLRSTSFMFLVVNPDCTRGHAFVVAHEMMHILGFDHEHQRQDRDCYINVIASYHDVETKYKKLGAGTDDISFPYDIHSIMHYQCRCLEPRYGDELSGPQGGLSKMDWMKLNHIYCGKPHIRELDPDAYKLHLKRQEEPVYDQEELGRCW